MTPARDLWVECDRNTNSNCTNAEQAWDGVQGDSTNRKRAITLPHQVIKTHTDGEPPR